LGNEVPFRTYTDQSRTHTEISPVNREQRRPIYEMVLNHYAGRRGVDAPFVRELAEQMRPEGFHGDHPGFGTILHTRSTQNGLVSARSLPAADSDARQKQKPLGKLTR
jgi:hypothetical protein